MMARRSFVCVEVCVCLCVSNGNEQTEIQTAPAANMRDYAIPRVGFLIKFVGYCLTNKLKALAKDGTHSMCNAKDSTVL